MTRGLDSLLEKWRRFRGRPVEDRLLLLQAAMFFPLTEIGLRLFGFQHWKELIERFSPFTRLPHTSPLELQDETARRVVRAVRSAELHILIRPNCLQRGMTLWWLLRRTGVMGKLQIGARKVGGRLEAHAWVELDGQVLDDGDDIHQHYERFDPPIAAAADDLRVSGKGASR